VEHRRSDRRYERKVPVDVTYEGKAYGASTLNISLGGMFIATEQALPFGAKVQLKFRVPTQTEPIEVEGQVRWSGATDDSNGRGIGVRFEGLRARDVWALNKFFDRPQE
jgi:uncharacterized protein (TIGR02266 family)